MVLRREKEPGRPSKRSHLGQPPERTTSRAAPVKVRDHRRPQPPERPQVWVVDKVKPVDHVGWVFLQRSEEVRRRATDLRERVPREPPQSP